MLYYIILYLIFYLPNKSMPLFLAVENGRNFAPGFADQRVHIGLLGSMVLVTIYNASSRYTTLGVAASLVEFQHVDISTSIDA